MKTAVLGLACLVCLAGVSRAETNWVGIQGGIGIPTGDFGDVGDLGFGFGATGTWMFAPTWGVGVDVGYHLWNGKDDVTPPGGDLSFNAIQATGHFLYMFPMEGSVKPWVKGALGIYNFSGKLEGAGPSFDFDESESDFGFNVGGGINLTANPNLTYGIGAAYHSIQAEDASADFITISVNVLFGVGGPQ